MQLSLSSAADPAASLANLLAGCARRGLDALELVEGHGHGVSIAIGADQTTAVRAAANEAGIRICAIQMGKLDRHMLESTARLAAALGAPVVVPAEGVDPEILSAAARTLRAEGASLLLAHDSDPAAVGQLQRMLATLPGSEVIGLAWDVRPDRDDPTLGADVLAAGRSRLRYVRLHGGGPESAEQTGRGVGALMARLALARYAGPVVLTPSTPLYSYVWRAWLARAGGWGCGSKQSDPMPLALTPSTITLGGAS